MKTALKVVLWSLIGITLALIGFTTIVGASENPAMEKLFDVAINLDLYWAYTLLVVAILGVIVAALVGTISNPTGLRKTLISIALVVVVVGTSVALVLTGDVPVITNSAGAVLDDVVGLRISEIGIYVIYIVAAITVLVVLYDVISGFVRRMSK